MLQNNCNDIYEESILTNLIHDSDLQKKFNGSPKANFIDFVQDSDLHKNYNDLSNGIPIKDSGLHLHKNFNDSPNAIFIQDSGLQNNCNYSPKASFIDVI